MRFILTFSMLALLSFPASAQQKYSSWSDPNAPATGSGVQSDSTRELVEKLNTLIDDAEKARAADPTFLKDLRALANSYSKPLQTTVLEDTFSDGDFTANPVWNVSAGRYWIEKDWGLRSAITAQPSAAQEQQTTKTDGKDVALAILGAVLKQATKGSSNNNQPASAAQETAVISSAAVIANALTIEFEMSSWQAEGQFDIGPYQGTNINSGYRLSYSPGGSLSLIRQSSRGSSIVQQATTQVPLEDQKNHSLTWVRDQSGRMSVTVDGTEVISAVDRGFSDPFDGVTMINRGGDYIVKHIKVSSLN